MTDYQTIQVWPSGRGYQYMGDPFSDLGTLKIRQDAHHTAPYAVGEYRPASEREQAEIQAELRAQRYLEREVLVCQSSLVDDLLRAGIDGWEYEEITNLYPDPSEWGAAECIDWLTERGIDAGDPPETAEADLDDLQQRVRDNAEPAEIYEWWLVTDWMAEALIAIGEPVLDNGYGYWWGRTCTGQRILMDGTLQEIARRHA